MEARKQVIAAANRRALDRLFAVSPAWTAVRPASEALGLPDKTLLHPGPPLNDPRNPPAPVLASAQLCCLHEGWANSMEAAAALIASGAVKLLPAQDFGAVTPLAAVISPSTTLVEVSDLAADSTESGAPEPGFALARRASKRRAWSLLGSGFGPQIRFGSRNPAILPRLAWRDGELARVLATALQAGPIELIPLARLGLEGGDDLHARTTSANLAVCEQLLPRLAGEGAQAVAGMLKSTPLFFLTLWMAACHLMLDAAAAEGEDSSLVVAFAGNGEQCGIRLAGMPSCWFTAPAAAPQGPRLDGVPPVDASAVIGDSGVIDALGFGAQALGCSPEIASVLAPWLPTGRKDNSALLDAHPAFAALGLKAGLDVLRVTEFGILPLAAIAMIDGSGEHGLLGRGVFTPPPEVFEKASAAILG